MSRQARCRPPYPQVPPGRATHARDHAATLMPADGDSTPRSRNSFVLHVGKRVFQLLWADDFSKESSNHGVL